MLTITEYFQNRSIFITGATGFVGKVLLEKLLRSCTGIRTIYVLIRPSKGKSPQERLQLLLESLIFQQLRKKRENVFDNVFPIAGDLTKEGLGISKEDGILLAENVSVVFHSAATIRFTEPLPVALNMNLEGTKRVIQVSKSMKNLSSIVYVSTAYSNADLHENPIEEVIYPAAFDPLYASHFFSRLQQLNILESITPSLLGGKPNTYVLSKNIAEKLVEMEASKYNLPICIVRPSMIAPIYQDPAELEGWVDSWNGQTGLFYCVVHGILYISPGDSSINYDVIPVDYVVKILILAAWETGARNMAMAVKHESLNNNQNCRVYNACMEQFSRISHGDYNKLVYKNACKAPASRMVRPPSIKLSTGWWWIIINFLAVGLPCLAFDFVFIMRRQKPFLTKQYKLAQYTNKLVAFFKLTDFKFKSDNVKAVVCKIPEFEKYEFDPQMSSINWSEYTENCIIGIRRYFDKEEDSTIPEARRKFKRLCRIYNIVDACFIIGISLVLIWTGAYIFFAVQYLY